MDGTIPFPIVPVGANNDALLQFAVTEVAWAKKCAPIWMFMKGSVSLEIQEHINSQELTLGDIHSLYVILTNYFEQVLQIPFEQVSAIYLHVKAKLEK